MKVLGMGNALVDVVVELPDDGLLKELGLRKGSMQLVDKEASAAVLDKIGRLPCVERSGGSAANTVCGLASLGVEAAFVGKVSNDRLGEVFRHDLRHYGVKPLVLEGEGDTGRAVSLVSRDGERTFATHLGVSIDMEPADLEVSLFDGYTHFYVEGYLMQHHELIRRAVELAKEAGMEVIIDMASYNVVEDNREFLRFLVKEYADIVFANDEEARAYTGLEDPEKAVAAIAADCWIAVVKTGERGSLIQNNRQLYRVAAQKVRCLDTTGAGDLYASGFLYGLHHGLKLPLCGEIGSIVAAKVIEVTGAKIPDETWPVIERDIKQVIYKQIE